MKYFNTIHTENKDDGVEPNLKYFLKKIPNINQKNELIAKIIQKYASQITFFHFFNESTALEGEIGCVYQEGFSEENFSDLMSFIELNKKLKTNEPFYHVFITGKMCTSNSGHWICLTLERDASGAYSWHGMDSWNNQTYVFIDIISTIHKIFNQFDHPNLEENFLKKWYQHIMNGLYLTRRADFRNKEKIMLDYSSRYLNYIKCALLFMKKANWLSQPEKYKDEKEFLNQCALFYSTNGFSNDPVVLDVLKSLDNPAA